MRGIAAGFALAMTVKPNALAILATLVAFAHCVRSAEDIITVRRRRRVADTHNRRSARTGAYFIVRDHVGTST